MRRITLPLLIAMITAGLIALLVITRPSMAPVEQAEIRWPVRVAVARFQDLRPVLELYGEIVAGRESELRALTPGPIAVVGDNFREGARVEAGELLLRVDPFDYEIALAEQSAAAAEAEAQLRLKEQDMERIEALFAEGNVSAQQRDTAELELDMARAGLERSQAAARRAERDLRDTRLVAPYDGVLVDVNANLGKQLSTSDRVARIVDPASLEVGFPLSNEQYGRLMSEGSLMGRPARIFWKVGEVELEYGARIERLGGEIAAASGGVRVFAELLDTSIDTPLRPGAFVRIELDDRLYPAVAAIPETALYGEDQVFVVESGRLKSRLVELHGYDGELMLLGRAQENALRDGEQVVITQLREAGENARAVVVE
ncbi:MAG: efflux RND transporter periplasmic adaptor subunit [Gammaproteobacteria bacterium]|nr:efflux RND transporter periplasmic adaptor subunit [Gammaproteobacteria bacterium]MXW44903.1 efflux RND transporter periplasmic adaptor subunit [Gammaproteobacteria bacterium]MYD02081.1 efflux RND transporter periplasmic adaptor subunit [Gammaproteobacteria bacterium]MYI24295.1 efflux RND transporter periplasmic adaptor subunit [Gammaproteobacteria bacterium]